MNLKYLLLVALCAVGVPGLAQPVDNWLWPSITVEAKMLKGLTLSVNGEGRINENYSNVRSVFGEFEANWRFNKYLATSLNYRIGGREDDDNEISDYVKGQRVSFFVYGRIKPGKFTLTNRLGILRQYLDSRRTPRDYIRNKLTLKFDVTKKVSPILYSEVFYRLDSDPRKIDEWRYGAGVEYQFNKQHAIKTLYIYAKQVNVNKPDIRSVISLGYTYTMRFKKEDGN
jgi:hypothetical protein